MGRTSAPGGSRRSPRRQGSRPGHPQRARPLALDSPPLRVVGKAQPWLRAAPAEDDVRTQGGVLGIGRWPHAKVAPCPSAENGHAAHAARWRGPHRRQPVCSEWRLHVQPTMGPAMVVADVFPQNSFCLPLVHDDHVVQTLPPQCPDHSFAVPVGLG